MAFSVFMGEFVRAGCARAVLGDQLTLTDRLFVFWGRVAALCLIAILVMASPEAKAAAERNVAFTPRPQWTTDVAIPQPRKSRYGRVAKGVYNLLVSRQFRFHDRQRHTYARFADKIISRSGLERASTISINFRPDFDRLKVHRIAIHRGDELIDLTKSVTFDVFQRERRLNRGVLNGELTAFANIPGVRVGDIVEYAYSIEFTSILMPGEAFGRFRMSWGTPTGILESRVVVPRSMKLQVRYAGRKSEPEVSDGDDERSYSWVIKDSEPLEYENEVPRWVPYNDWIEYSSISSWAAIADESVPHYRAAGKLPSALVSELDDLASTTEDPIEQLTSVLALIQSKIRYVSISIGRGAFIPRSPTIVWTRGYGDCKDKAQLMVGALAHLGIEAVPVLAHLREGKGLKDRLPSPWAFDHVMVRVELGGKTYWLDPTRTDEYDADPMLSQANYGYVLPVMIGADNLVKIDPWLPRRPEIDVTEKITLGYKKGQDPVTLEVISIYTGKEAVSLRDTVAEDGEDVLSDRYLEYYAGHYPGVERAADTRFSDNRFDNKFTVYESYRIDPVNLQEKFFEKIPVRGDAVRSKIVEVSAKGRQYPAFLRFPIWVKHTVEVDNTPYAMDPLDSTWLIEPYLNFASTSFGDDSSHTFIWQLRTLRNQVEADDVARLQEIREKIDYESHWTYNLTPSQDKPAESKADL